MREKYIAKAILGLVTATTCLPGYANQDSEIIEQRFKELEMRLAVAEQRAINAEAQVAALAKNNQASARMTDKNKQSTNAALEKRLTIAEDNAAKAMETANRLSSENDALTAEIKKANGDIKSNGALTEKINDKIFNDEFKLTGYARSGVIMNNNASATHSGPYLTPAGDTGGAVGRLGNEYNTYWDLSFEKYNNLDNGARTHYKLQLADGTRNYNNWTASDSELNTRQIFMEISNLPSFSGIFKNSSIWGGKRADAYNYDIHWLDSDIIDLAGTGGGIDNIEWSGNFHSNFSLYGRSFDDLDSNIDNDNYISTTGKKNVYVQNYILVANNFYGPFQFMLTGMKSADNDKRINEGSTYRSHGAGTGVHTVLGYKDEKSFYGMRDGWSRTTIVYGHGLGAEVKSIGSNGDLTSAANTVRFQTFGASPLNEKWSIAPVIMAQRSSDRYVHGDDYKWATVNVRLLNEITENFGLQYEASYQYMDLDPQQFNSLNKVKGSFYKFTVAPTFKPRDFLNFFSRPEIRLFATWMDWDKELDNYSDTDAFGSNGFTAGGQWNFGVQMETFF